MRSAIVDALQEQVDLGNVKLNYFAFNLAFTAVAPGSGTTPLIFQISNNMNFLLSYITGAVYSVAGTFVAQPDLTINLADVSTGWLFSDSPLPWVSMVGTSQEPFILPEPKLVPSNASIQCKVVNRTAATTFAEVDLTIHGSQVFTYNGFTIDDLPVMG